MIRLAHLSQFVAAEMCKMLKVPILQRFERIYFVEKQYFSTASVENFNDYKLVISSTSCKSS